MARISPLVFATGGAAGLVSALTPPAAAQAAAPAGAAAPAALALVALLALTLAALGAYRLRDARRQGALRARLEALSAAEAELRDASLLVRLFEGRGPALAALERERAAIAEASRRLALAISALGRWRPRRLSEIDAESRALEARAARLREALKALRVDESECRRVLASAEGALAELGAYAERPWCRDLRPAVDAHAAALDAARRFLEAGDPLTAMEAWRTVADDLPRLREVVSARQTSADWLASVPRETAALEDARRRLVEAGYRDLPPVPVAELERAAEAARGALRAGEVEGAGRKQTALKARLAQLREAIAGREARALENARKLKRLRFELTQLEARLAALPDEASQARYPERLLRPAYQARAAAFAGIARMRAALSAAEADNQMDAQRFEAASERLAEAGMGLRDLQAEVARCQGLCQTLATDESRLLIRHRELMGRVASAHARARTMGLSPDLGLEVLLESARNLLSQRPTPLDDARVALGGLAHALARYEARLDALDDRLETPVRIVKKPRAAPLAGRKQASRKFF